MYFFDHLIKHFFRLNLLNKLESIDFFVACGNTIVYNARRCVPDQVHVQSGQTGKHCASIQIVMEHEVFVRVVMRWNQVCDVRSQPKSLEGKEASYRE